MQGDVPAGWARKPLIALADYHNGRAFKPSDWTAEGLPIIRISNMRSPDAVWNSYDGPDVDDRDRVADGDLLFSWSATLMTVLWNRGPAILNQHIFKVTEKPGHDRTFVKHMLDHYIDALAEMSHGSTMKHIKRGALTAFKAPVPPLPEQKKIAAILSSVDEAIQATQAVIEQTRRVKEGLLQDLLTRGIGHRRFRRTAWGGIPASWDLHTLTDLAEVRSGIAKNSKKQFADPLVVPYLRVANVQDGFLDLSEVKSITIERSQLPRYALRDGDVLMNEGGDIDKLGRGDVWRAQIDPCVHQNHVFSVRCGSRLLPRYLSYLAASTYGKAYFLRTGKQTTNLASINKTQLGDFPVPLPTLSEQGAIVERLDAVRASAEQGEREVGRLRRVKAGLLQDLLTGKVRVSV